MYVRSEASRRPYSQPILSGKPSTDSVGGVDFGSLGTEGAEQRYGPPPFQEAAYPEPYHHYYPGAYPEFYPPPYPEQYAPAAPGPEPGVGASGWRPDGGASEAALSNLHASAAVAEGGMWPQGA
jgi:hypothetical protein